MKNWIMALCSMLLASIGVVSLAQAGGEAHGGRTWICDNTDGTKTYELVDYQYGYEMMKLDIQLPDGADEYEIIEKVLKRLDRLDKGRADVYRRLVREFEKKRLFTTNEYFEDPQDVTLINGERRKNCIKAVFIYQTDLDNYKFLVSQPVWEKLDARMRAGGILHEIIYEEAILEGHKTADAAMKLNAYIASRQIDSYSLEQWMKILSENNLGYFSDGLLLETKGLELGQDGAAKRGTLRPVQFPGANLFEEKDFRLVAAGDFERSEGGILYFQIHEGSANVLNQTVKLGGDVYYKPRAWLGGVAADNFLARVVGARDSVWVDAFIVDLSAEQPRLVALRTPRYSDSVKVKTTNGEQASFASEEWMFFAASTGLVPLPKNGIYSLISKDQFIRIEKNKGKIGFRLCRLNDSYECERIGSKDFYTKSQVKKVIKTSLRKAGFSLGDHNLLAIISVLGPFGLLMSGPVCPALAVIGGIAFVVDFTIGYWQQEHHMDDKVMERAAKRTLLKAGYLVTDLPLEHIRAELEASLAQVQ